MSAIVGGFKVNGVGRRGVVDVGECMRICRNSEVKRFGGGGSFNRGDELEIRK
ncbi:spore germination protein [Bacillus sp. WP8]|uniref:spore germination protein n=1 Tax=Bacillus sp. WP8 TaxID=756828 RepID=UPI0011A34DB2|nr:spore germination protein [Bacillus sp. WP8]